MGKCGDGTLLLLFARPRAQKKLVEPKEAKADVSDYIERFYNPKPKHSTIGDLNAIDFEWRVGSA